MWRSGEIVPVKDGTVVRSTWREHCRTPWWTSLQYTSKWSHFRFILKFILFLTHVNTSVYFILNLLRCELTVKTINFSLITCNISNYIISLMDRIIYLNSLWYIHLKDPYGNFSGIGNFDWFSHTQFVHEDLTWSKQYKPIYTFKDESHMYRLIDWQTIWHTNTMNWKLV